MYKRDEQTIRDGKWKLLSYHACLWEVGNSVRINDKLRNAVLSLPKRNAKMLLQCHIYIYEDLAKGKKS